MLVFVTTRQQLFDAVAQWVEADPSEERRIVQRVFSVFLASPEARPLRAATGLYSFVLDQWHDALARWRAHELERQPDSADNINRYTTMLEELFSSAWPIEAKLVVRECLDEGELEDVATA